MKRIFLLFAALITFAASVSAANPVIIDGVTYNYNGTCWYVSGYTEDLPEHVTITTLLEMDGSVSPVEYVGYQAFLPYEDPEGGSLTQTHIKTVQIEKGDIAFSLIECSFSGWTNIESIDLPENTSLLQEGCISKLKALKELIIRSEKPVDFEKCNAIETNIGSNPILYVPASAYNAYISMIDGSGSVADVFLSQMSEIRTIDGEPVPETPELTVQYLNTRITLHDAKPGHRLHFSSESGTEIQSLYSNADDHTEFLNEGVYTIPEVTVPTTLQINYATPAPQPTPVE